MAKIAGKPRCDSCKCTLIKGEVIEGIARIKCGNCGHVNVLNVKKIDFSSPVFEPKRILGVNGKFVSANISGIR